MLSRAPILVLQQCFDPIVFDWDGTLMDSMSAVTRSIQLACRDLDLPVPNDIWVNHATGLSLRDVLECAVPTLDPADYDRLVDRYRFHYLSRDAHLVLFPGVQEVLEALRHQNYLLAVTADGSRVGLRCATEATNLTSVFDSTHCTDEMLPKPYPTMLLKLTRDLGMEVERTMIVGDTTHDLQMTTNAGAVDAIVTYGTHSTGMLDPLTPLYSAKSVPGPHSWLAQHA